MKRPQWRLLEHRRINLWDQRPTVGYCNPQKRRTKDDVQATPKGQMVKMTEGPGMQQWNKGLRHKTAARSVEGENNLQDLQEDHRAGDQKANSQVFDWATGNE
jgi:hypothetical protein